MSWHLEWEKGSSGPVTKDTIFANIVFQLLYVRMQMSAHICSFSAMSVADPMLD